MRNQNQATEAVTRSEIIENTSLPVCSYLLWFYLPSSF